MLQTRSRELPDAGYQFCAGYFNDYCSTVGIFWFLQSTADDLTQRIKALDPKDEKGQSDLRGRLQDIKSFQALFLLMMQVTAEETPADTKAITATVPSLAVRPQASATERLFYSAHIAALNSFRKDAIKSKAQQVQLSDEVALAAMCQGDVTMASYMASADGSQILHESLAGIKEDRDRRFVSASAADAHAINLATASGLMLRYSGLLQATKDDQGHWQYGRTDLFNNLLTTAREVALANIAACKGRGLTCVAAISEFEEGEMGRDDKDEDKVRVLSHYWAASLEAKAMMMLAVEGHDVGHRP
jgi:hypothetical protein